MSKPDLIATEEINFVRDKNNSAVLNTNINELNEKRRQRDISNNTSKKIQTLENQLEEIKLLLLENNKQ